MYYMYHPEEWPWCATKVSWLDQVTIERFRQHLYQSEPLYMEYARDPVEVQQEYARQAYNTPIPPVEWFTDMLVV